MMFYVQANSMPLAARDVPSWQYGSASIEESFVTLRRRIALIFFGALTLAGAYDAVRNLPVLSGCYFYAECPQMTTEARTAPVESPAHPSLQR
jgi:hypothetical protein